MSSYFTLKAISKTMTGAAVQVGTEKIPSNAIIVAEVGTVYVGNTSSVTTANGFPVTVGNPIAISSFMLGGNTEDLDLTNIYAIGTAANLLKILYMQKDS
jgi:hypothetical protein